MWHFVKPMLTSNKQRMHLKSNNHLYPQFETAFVHQSITKTVNILPSRNKKKYTL